MKADGAGSLVDRLGTPEAYAAEPRATAGLVGGFPDPPTRSDKLADLRAAALRRLSAADLRVGPLLGYERASEFLALLRPAWWVLRGCLAAMVVAWALDDGGQPVGLLPRFRTAAPSISPSISPSASESPPAFADPSPSATIRPSTAASPSRTR